MSINGFDHVFEESAQAKKLDYSFFRLDPAFHFLTGVGDQINAVDGEALKIAAEKNVNLFLKYLAVEKPLLGYGSGSLAFHPLDKVDCRHIMMSTVIFSHLKGKIPNIVEIGGGFGNWARLNLPVIDLDSWTIIDLPFVQDLQKWYLLNAIDKNYFWKLNFQNANSDYNLTPNLIIATHSLSEISWAKFIEYGKLLDSTEHLFYSYHKDYPSSDLTKLKMAYLSQKFDIVDEVFSEQGTVRNLLMKSKVR